MEFYENAIGEEGNGKSPHEFHFPRRNSEPCLWLLLRLKSSMQLRVFIPRIRRGSILMRDSFQHFTVTLFFLRFSSLLEY